MENEKLLVNYTDHLSKLKEKLAKADENAKKQARGVSHFLTISTQYICVEYRRDRYCIHCNYYHVSTYAEMTPWEVCFAFHQYEEDYVCNGTYSLSQEPQLQDYLS